jgi:hypothetical protein
LATAVSAPLTPALAVALAPAVSVALATTIAIALTPTIAVPLGPSLGEAQVTRFQQSLKSRQGDKSDKENDQSEVGHRAPADGSGEMSRVGTCPIRRSPTRLQKAQFLKITRHNTFADPMSD